MIKRNIILFFTSFVSGCQGGQNAEISADINTEVRENADTSIDTPIRHCKVKHNLQDGSYITAGADKVYLYKTNPSTSLASDPDLWDIIAKAFELPVPDDQRIQHYKQWYLNNPLHIDTVTARAEPFLFYIYQQIKKREMPTELVLLPFIESSFDQFAQSNRGASGLWQITLPTGKAFGLEYLKGYDGRRDIIASTEAALDLLEYLYKKFNGDWLHAIAAYNTGEGRVRKAIKQNKSTGKPTDFWSLHLPKETRLYVPKLLAMADLVKLRDIHDLKLAYIKPEPVLTEVVIRQRVKLQLIANHAGISSKELYGLNPGYTSGYTFQGRDNTILIPKSSRGRFYANVNSSGYMANSDDVEQRFTVHHIQPGDSLSELAYLNNTTVSLIMSANDLSDPTIIAGQPLLIPAN